MGQPSGSEALMGHGNESTFMVSLFWLVSGGDPLGPEHQQQPKGKLGQGDGGIP